MAEVTVSNPPNMAFWIMLDFSSSVMSRSFIRPRKTREMISSASLPRRSSIIRVIYWLVLT